MAKKKAEKPKPVAIINRVMLIDCEDCGEAEVTGVDADIEGSVWLSLCFECLGQRLAELKEEVDEQGRWHRVNRQ